KVYGSEVFDMVVDEGVQIHGGYGYISEYIVERAYRDSRINRIFEGTNEINRLLIPGTMLKNALKGRFPFSARLKEIQEEIADASKRPGKPEGPLADEIQAVDLMKRGVLLACNVGNEAHMMDIMEHKKGQTQMAMLDMADLIMETYACDSLVARCLQLLDEKGEEKSSVPLAMMRLYLSESLDMVRSVGRRLVSNASPEKKLEANLAVFSSYVPFLPYNTHDLQDLVGAHMADRERYTLD
ncbi:MAG: acyl-CoA dehydrogenase, partial [Deltaproteobacteria bacterium]|nr:acyl-CoA dehydrogenase [Deltaproteobacteria bacterium]